MDPNLNYSDLFHPFIRDMFDLLWREEFNFVICFSVLKNEHFFQMNEWSIENKQNTYKHTKTYFKMKQTYKQHFLKNIL